MAKDEKKDEKKVPFVPLAHPNQAPLTPQDAAQLLAMAQQAAEAHREQASGNHDRIASLKKFLLSLDPHGNINMNELVYAAWQKLTKDAKPAVQFVHRGHEALLVPADAIADKAVLLKVGKSGLVAGCPGRNGFFKNDVPEALVGTVHLQIEIRDETTEPQWKNCFAIAFKSAVPAPKRNTTTKGKKGDQGGQQGTANKKNETNKTTEQQPNTNTQNTQQTTVHSQQPTDESKAAAGQEGPA